MLFSKESLFPQNLKIMINIISKNDSKKCFLSTKLAY